MLFNSVEFLLFFPIVYLLYWYFFKHEVKTQNLLIVLASYVFYGWWDWRFLSLILMSTVVDYFVGIQIGGHQEARVRKRWLWCSVLFNLGLLGFFKYYNFFVDSFGEAVSGLGYDMDLWTLEVIIPVGISFYTFQTMSYTLDIYNRKLQPTTDFVAFAAFVSFFPQLVAGPIERASRFLPQILAPRTYDKKQTLDGVQLIILGLFRKIAIADQLAPVVNKIFDNYTDLSGPTLILGALLFSIQIYADFSGYSSIARGLAKMLGFELMVNFNFPYFSRNIGEFWRRWHISLSTWFRDYLYIPLGGSRGGRLMRIRNVFVIFLVSGLWHGANWTFVIWGGVHALLFVPALVLDKNRKYTDALIEEGRLWPSVSVLFKMLMTFSIVSLAWILFRAEDMHHALGYYSGIIDHGWSTITYSHFLIIVTIVLIVDWVLLIEQDRWWFWCILIGAVLAGIVMSRPSEFIYFQF